MAFYKPSLFAENNAVVQHACKQEHLLLNKKVQFIDKQEKQARAFVSADQQLVLRRMKTNLDRSVIASKKIAKIRSTTYAENSPKSDVSSDLRTAWSEKNPLSAEAVTEVISTQDALPESVSVPFAVSILRSRGRRVHPTILKKLENLNQSPMSPNPMEVTSKVKPRKVSAAGLEQRRGSETSTSSSGSVRRLMKKHPRRWSVAPVLNVQSTTAAAVVDKEFATAMWVASQDHGKAATENVSVKCRPLSAEPKIESSGSRRITGKLTKEEDSRSGISTLQTPPPSHKESDLRFYEDTLTAQSLDDLESKLNEAHPEITLVDLHRAAVATKNYPQKIKLFLQKINKFKSPSTAISIDYYANRLSALKVK